MKTLYLDIETIPCQNQAIRDELAAEISPPGNMSKPETIAAWERDKKPAAVHEAWLKTSFDGALGQICVIGWAFDDGAPATIWSRKPCELAWEASIIKGFFAQLAQVPEQYRHALKVVGHRVVDFDLRFIWQRAVIHGIKPPFWMPWDSKPWGDRVFDTMVQWAGTKNHISLDKLCKVLGVAGKGSEILEDIDGSKVWEFVQAGRIADVATYCAGDVERARQIHQRMTFADTRALQEAA